MRALPYARSAAENMTDPEFKRMMLDVVAGYEWLAKRAEERKSGRQDRS